MKTVLLKDVAAAAGVSLAAASMALSGHARIAESTRRRVARVARRLGYDRDPLLGALSAYRRGGASRRTPPPQLAFFTSLPDERTLLAAEWARLQFDAARAAARARGYGLQLYSFAAVPGAADGAAGGAAHHARVLRSRGVCGVLVGSFDEGAPAPAFDWDGFPCAALGDNLSDLPIPRARFDHYRTMRLACATLRAEGHRRPALLVSAAHHGRHQAQSAAAFLVEAHDHDEATANDAAARVWIFEDFDPAAAARWLARARADVVIAVNPGVAEAIAPLLVRGERLVCFGRSPRHRSIVWPNALMAEAAVNLLHQRIAARTRGFAPAREQIDFVGELQAPAAAVAAPAPPA